MIDTGATRSCVSADIGRLYPNYERSVAGCPLRMGDDSVVVVKSSLVLPFALNRVHGTHEFLILPNLPVPFLIGLDLLAKHSLLVCPVRKTLIPSNTVLHCLPAARPTDQVCGLNSSQEERLQVLLKEYNDIFATDSKPFGRTHLAEHIIDTGDASPIHQGLRPTSPSDRAVVQSEVTKMLEAGAIRPSTSPWASPIVLVTKKDDTVRFCIDFRKINDVTKKDVFPLPRISDLLESMASARFFTTLDAASGYWQIPVASKDIEKTAFITSEGLFEFVVMPFGLCNAPATYQRLMNQLLGGLTWQCSNVYIDDIIVYSATFEDHLRHLREVLGRLRAAGMLLKRKKCLIAQSQVAYLGHVVSAVGISPDPAKVAKLKSFPAPTDKKELRSFLGLAGYYRRFVKHYARKAAPLFELLRGDVPFVWEDAQRTSFEEILNSVKNDAVLQHPRFDLPFLLDTDASDSGLGAVLSQVIDGVERPIAFASRRLQPAERKWAIREKEALAIIWGLETYRHFLLGAKFVVRTDHSSLTVLQAAKTGRLARWAIRLGEFGDFGIAHRAGCKHSNVDALTRVPLSDTVPDHATYLTIADINAKWSLTELARRQKEDCWCQHERRAWISGLRPRYQLVDRILCLKDFKPSRLLRVLLPESLRLGVVQEAHGMAHLGVKRVLAFLNERYVWPRMGNAVKKVISECLPCLQRKPPIPRAGLLSSSPPTSPWSVVAMDFCGPYLTSRHGNRFILVFVDQFTKMVELCPSGDQLASTVTKCFYERIICRYGLPDALLSDRGPQFRSKLVEVVCATFNIRKVFSSAYYPQGDGFAERFMRTMNNSLSILCRQAVADWDQFIPGLAFAYNVTEHTATGFTPFFLNFGRVPRLPKEGERPILNTGTQAEQCYAHRLYDVLVETYAEARNSVQQYWARMKQRFDKNRKNFKLTEGSLVLVRLSDFERSQFVCRKLAPRWSSPAKVVGVKSNGVTYDVERVGHNVEAVHVSRLLPLGFHVTSEEIPALEPKACSKLNAFPQFPFEEDDDEEVSTGVALSHPLCNAGLPCSTAIVSSLRSSPSQDSPFVDISASSLSASRRPMFNSSSPSSGPPPSSFESSSPSQNPSSPESPPLEGSMSDFVTADAVTPSSDS